MMQVHREILRKEIVDQCVRKMSFIATVVNPASRATFMLMLHDLVSKFLLTAPMSNDGLYYFCFEAKHATPNRLSTVMDICRMCDAVIYVMFELQKDGRAMFEQQYKVPTFRASRINPFIEDIIQCATLGCSMKCVDLYWLLHDNPHEFWSTGAEYGLFGIIDPLKGRNATSYAIGKKVLQQMRQISHLDISPRASITHTRRAFQKCVNKAWKYTEDLRETAEDQLDRQRCINARLRAYLLKLDTLLQPMYAGPEFYVLRGMRISIMEEYERLRLYFHLA